MPRLSDAPGHEEAIAAHLLIKLAEAVQDAGYYTDRPLPPATLRAITKFYKAAKTIVEYYTSDHVLCWNPPDFKFRPKEKK